VLKKFLPLAAVFVLLTISSRLFASSANAVAATGPTHVTSYDSMLRQLAVDQRRSALVHISTIGYSAKHHRQIVLVQVGTPDSKKFRIMVLCRQHGDEPSGTEAALALINRLSTASDASKELRFAEFYIVPMVNPDGAEAGTRLNGVLADLNRDWGVFHQPETAAVQKEVTIIHPQFILDIHSWDMVDPFQQICLEGPRGEIANQKLLLSLADLQARAAYGLAALSKQSVAATTYGQYSEGTLAHRYFLEHDHTASLLFETAPGPNYGQSLATRTELVETLLNWLVLDTSVHVADWARLAAAEPYLTYRSTAKKLIKTQVSTVTAARSTINLRWIPFIITCLLILWIGSKKRGLSEEKSNQLPARFRRYAHTSWHVVVPHQAQSRRQMLQALRQQVRLRTLKHDKRKVRFEPRPGGRGPAGAIG